ncbi:MULTISPECIES: DUF6176 family protein [Enterococcus]|uniref:DUF6176 family protein n=1 Tax=Enterococcus TaxID=1350 RepID=UPI00065E2323|nr:MULTISPECIES: DUF6176 family protein [Enterococcus]KAF1300766.1 hypothetical protein BAU16_11840 [Enterococcus sp. JM9B]
MPNIELTRFKVKTGKSKIVDEWLLFLNENMEETLITLEKEKMFIETIFREVVDGEEYLYWYSVQGKGGQEVEESEDWIDKKHLAYWKECIDTTFIPVDLTTEVVMIPKNIKKHMV